MRYLSLAMALALSLSSSLHSAEQIGEEYIKPIEYPKYILMGHYSNMRHGSLDSTIKSPLTPTLGGSIGFDVGLYKYLNAGALLTVNTGNLTRAELAYLHLTLFTRPQITIFERLSIFARLGGGPSVLFGYPTVYYSTFGSEDLKKQVFEKFPFPTEIANAGVHGMATIGIEYFPISRFGITAEWGIWADYMWTKAIGPRPHEEEDLQRRIKEGRAHPSEIENFNRKKNAKSFGYFSYEMPFMISLNIIL